RAARLKPGVGWKTRETIKRASNRTVEVRCDTECATRRRQIVQQYRQEPVRSIVLAVKGQFYEFHMDRVVSRPGAVLATKPGIEIGPGISRELALARVRAGKDVYPLAKEDAYRLATQAVPGRPIQESPHRPSEPTPSNRTDVYFRHYHPGGLHPQPGNPGH